MIGPEDENPNNLDDADDVSEIKASDDLNEPDAEDKNFAPTEAANQQAASDRAADAEQGD